jgi:hypothetical protein
MPCDDWNRVYLETVRRLECYRRRVREGVDVDNCLDFARFVIWSNIPKLMAANPPENPRLRELFPYDGADMLRMAKALESECQDYFQGRTRDSDGTAKGANKSDLEDIGRKLETISVRLSALESLAASEPVKTTDRRAVAERKRDRREAVRPMNV